MTVEELLDGARAGASPYPGGGTIAMATPRGGVPPEQGCSVKALSVVGPNGSAIAAGIKPIELRTWYGDIDPDQDLLIVENTRLLTTPDDEDPAGKPVAIVRVAEQRPYTPADVEAACEEEFVEGLVAWVLADVRPVFVPATTFVRAARKIYEVELPADAEVTVDPIPVVV
jgi:hypothetical protein